MVPGISIVPLNAEHGAITTGTNVKNFGLFRPVCTSQHKPLLSNKIISLWINIYGNNVFKNNNIDKSTCTSPVLYWLQAGLRELDVSLLCQLWSLNDAIQEYKVAVQDRYSETTSEYSWGMNSRSSSIGSFDDYDWNADIHLKPDSYMDSPLHGSTSSLLQQINELKERAESEFI